jgi:hypothetical protein
MLELERIDGCLNDLVFNNGPKFFVFLSRGRRIPVELCQDLGIHDILAFSKIVCTDLMIGFAFGEEVKEHAVNKLHVDSIAGQKCGIQSPMEEHLLHVSLFEVDMQHYFQLINLGSVLSGRMEDEVVSGCEVFRVSAVVCNSASPICITQCLIRSARR